MTAFQTNPSQSLSGKDWVFMGRKEKTGNVWDATGATFEKKPNKYQLLKRRRATARSEEIVQPFYMTENAKSKLPRMLWRTIDSICDLFLAS